MKKYSLCFAFFLFLIFSLSSLAQDRSQPFNLPLDKVWKFTVEARETTGYRTAIFATPLFDNLKIYLASANGTISAIFKGDQQLSWQFLANESIRLEMILKGYNLFVASGKDIFALEKNTGAVNWVFSAEANIVAGLVNEDKCLAFADLEGKIYCLDSEDGKLLWQFAEEELSAVTSEIIIVEGQLIYGNEKGVVNCLNIKDGSKRWTFKTEGAVRSGFCHYEGLLYFGSDDNYIYALNRTNGSQRWKQRTAGDVRGYPIIAGDFLFISSRDRTIRVVDKKSGSFSHLGVIKLTKNSNVRPLVIDETMVYSQEKEIAGIGPNNNMMSFGRITLENDVTSPPAFDDREKLLYVGLRDGSLQALSSRNQLEEKRMVKDETAKVSEPEAGVIRVSDPVKIDKKKGENKKKIPAPVEKKENEPEADNEINKKPEVVNQPVEKIVSPEIIEPDSAMKETIENEISGESGSLHEEAIAALKKDGFARAAFLCRHLLKDKAESHFTISMGLYCKEDSIKELLKKLNPEQSYLFAKQYKDSVCYFVCSGIYPDKAAAAEDITKIKEILGQAAEVKSYRLDSFIN